MTVKYFIFKEHCIEKFLAFDLSDRECIRFTLSKSVGFAIIGGSGILKIPQILKIVGNKSVEGLSSMSNYIEVSIMIRSVSSLSFFRQSFTCKQQVKQSIRAFHLVFMVRL